MRSSLHAVRAVAGTSLVPILLSLLLGTIFYGSALFKIHLSSFQIVITAVNSSLFLLTLRIDRRNAFALLLVLVVLGLGFLARSVNFTWFLRDILFTVALASSLHVFYVSFYLRTVRLRYLHPLVLAAIMMFFNVASSVAVIFLMRLDRSMQFSRLLDGIQIKAMNSFLVGLGTGIGLLLLDNGIARKTSDLLRSASKSLKDDFEQFRRNP